MSFAAVLGDVREEPLPQRSPSKSAKDAKETVPKGVVLKPDTTLKSGILIGFRKTFILRECLWAPIINR